MDGTNNHQNPNENNLVENLKNYLETTPEEELQREWDATREWDNVGPVMEEFLNTFKKSDRFFDEAWNIYQISVLEKFEKDTLISNYAITNLDDFVTRIIKDENFAKEWRFEVDQREMGLKERAKWLQYFKGYDLLVGNLEHDRIREVVESESPTKSIKVTYNNKTIQFYE